MNWVSLCSLGIGCLSARWELVVSLLAGNWVSLCALALDCGSLGLSVFCLLHVVSCTIARSLVSARLHDCLWAPARLLEIWFLHVCTKIANGKLEPPEFVPRRVYTLGPYPLLCGFWFWEYCGAGKCGQTRKHLVLRKV